MAKINNQAVMQKLIDDLKLYPAKDVIPTELAEKILPVFQINSEEIEIKTPTADVVESLNFNQNSVAETIYTVPATGKFYLTNVWMQMNLATNNQDMWINVTINGVVKKILGCYDATGTATVVFDSYLSLNLQNPILLDAGTVISAQGNEEHASSDAMVGIVGYTE